MFSTCFKNFLSFYQIWNCCLPFLSGWKIQKFVFWARHRKRGVSYCKIFPGTCIYFLQPKKILTSLSTSCLLRLCEFRRSLVWSLAWPIILLGNDDSYFNRIQSCPTAVHCRQWLCGKAASGLERILCRVLVIELQDRTDRCIYPWHITDIIMLKTAVNTIKQASFVNFVLLWKVSTY